MKQDQMGLLKGVLAYYDSIIAEHGAVPQGVGWGSRESQYVKFEQLYRIVWPVHHTFSVNEVGCGYGAFADFLEEKGVRAVYHGYDISRAMIEAAAAHLSMRNSRIEVHLHHNEKMQQADYAVASGIFNANMGPDGGVVDRSKWERYVIGVLDEMNEASSMGFSFNMQTIYSEYFTEYFYGDPCFYFDHCKRRYSRNVALLHDYDLYDFTILVRKKKA